jgi:ubiquinone/menaquinone biosynthesis C-methylase UbiE
MMAKPRMPAADDPAKTEPREPGYLPALRFRALTPLFDLVVRGTTRERAVKEGLLAQADLQDGQRVLDLGSGTGTLAIMARRRAACEVVGIDADPEILEIARRKADVAGVEVRFDEGTATELPYEEASFDRVLSSLFFHHLTSTDKRTVLGEVARVLRPAGELHLADFTAPADPLQAVLSWQVRLFDEVERTRENFAGELPQLLAAAGLSHVRERRRLRTVVGTIGLLGGSRLSAS